MSIKVKWPCTFPGRWEILPAKRLFPESKERAPESDEQLSATQEYGVISQAEFIRLAGRRVVQLNQHLDRRKRVEVGDFVISMRSFQGGLERAWTAGGIRSSYVVLKPRADLVLGYYQRLFKSQDYIQALQSTANFIRDGQDLNYQNFVLIDLPFPPLSEQRTIAAFLDHETARIDALIAEQEWLIDLLKEKRQALISHAVTKGLDPTVPMKDSGVEWLGEVPAHWDLKKVAYVCEIHNNLRTPIDRDIRAKKSGPYPYYGPTGILDYIDEFHVEGEYFLLGEDGDHFLKFNEKPMTFRVNGKFCVNNHAHLLRGKGNCSTDWAALCFETRDLSPWLIKQGVARYKLRKEILANIPIAVPPLTEQVDILEHINLKKITLNNAISQSEESIKLLQERRSALISAAVTGKIDVRVWQAPEHNTPAATLEAAYG